MNIDWSKAPEGATHWEPASEHIIASWMKLEGETWFYWPPESDKPKWNRARRITGERADRMIPRPTTWNGEGLPPVGTVCEVLNNTLDNPAWERCTILFMGKFKVVYESESCHERVADVSESWMISFRPLRTPELVAAEERLHNVRNACSAIADTLDGLRGKTKVERAALAVVEAMIDAGYRKQEQTK